MFLSNSDPLIRGNGTDPDPSIIKQKLWKKVRKTFISTVTFFTFYLWRMYIQKVISKKIIKNKIIFSWSLDCHWQKEQDPDPKCHGSGTTLVESFKRWYFNFLDWRSYLGVKEGTVSPNAATGRSTATRILSAPWIHTESLLKTDSIYTVCNGTKESGNIGLCDIQESQLQKYENCSECQIKRKLKVSGGRY